MEAQNDHDLLIRIDTKLDIFVRQTAADITDIKERVTELEREADQRRGFFRGANWLWSFIGALPPTLILLVYGAKG